MGEGKFNINVKENDKKQNEDRLCKIIKIICVAVVIVIMMVLMHIEFIENQKTERLKLMIEAGEKGIEVKYEQ